MINLREIRETIEEIRQNGNTISQAERLALLYIAAEHMEREERVEREERGYSQADQSDGTIDVEGKSEFLAACRGARIEDVLVVMDEHMEAIRLLYPREYDAIVQKIGELEKGG